MSKILSLSKVMFKISLDSFRVSKKKSLNILFVVFMVLFLLVPVFMLFRFLFKNTLEILITMNQEALLINVLLAGLSLVIIFFSMLQIPYIYYFSNDTETYLALPLKPYEILLSRLFVVLIFEYLLVFVMMVPFIFTFFEITGSIGSIIIGLIASIFIPIGPVIISSIVVILLMNFVPFFKNKNAINVIFGLLAFAFSIGINVVIQGQDFSQIDLLLLLLDGNNSISNTMFALLPNIRFASSAIVNQSVLDLLIFIGITLGLVVIYLFAAQKFYLNGATTISDSARNKKRFNRNQLSTGRQSSLVSTFLTREIKTLLRTPAYLLNGLLHIFLIPIMIDILQIFCNFKSDLDMTSFMPLLNQYLNDIQLGVPIALIAGVVIGLFIGSMNMLSVTALSREAKVLDHIKAYPIDHYKMMLGKLIFNIGLSLLGVVLTIVVIYVWITLPLLFNLLVLVSSIIAVTFTNLFGMLVDLFRPNLKWTNEIQVIKQGLNGFINIFGLWMLIGILGFIAWQLRDYFFYTTIGLTVFILIASLVILYFLKVNTSDLVIKAEA